MNVAYNQINSADAARIIGVDYTTVVGWCRDNKINSTNIGEGVSRGRYMISEDEVDYLKTLRQKFGRQFMRKYRKDWQRGKQPAETYTKEESQVTFKDFQYIDTDSVITNTSTDIDDIANKIRTIQRIKTRLEELDNERQKLSEQLEELRDEVMNYL